jgi:hypothetical protein
MSSFVGTVFLRCCVLSSTEPVVPHVLISLETQDFVGTSESGYLQANLSLHSAQVLFGMYVSTINIL